MNLKKTQIKFLDEKIRIVKKHMDLPPHEIKRLLKEKYGYKDVTTDEMMELIIRVHSMQNSQMRIPANNYLGKIECESHEEDDFER